jgi:hypothetical protein
MDTRNLLQFQALYHHSSVSEKEEGWSVASVLSYQEIKRLPWSASNPPTFSRLTLLSLWLKLYHVDKIKFKIK